MKRISALILVIACFMFLYEPVFARMTIPGRTDKMVNDYAGILDDATKKDVEELSASVRDKSPDPVEVIVATFPSIDDWPFEEFRRQYGENWRHTRKGSKYRDNGVIILVAFKEKRVSAGAGQNLKAILSDKVINDILRNEIMTEFKKGDFNSGIKKGVEKIVNILNNAKIPVDSPIFNFKNLVILILLLLAIAILKKYLRK